MRGEHERRNERKFINVLLKRKQRKIRITRQNIKRNKKKWIVIGGSFFIISRIIN